MGIDSIVLYLNLTLEVFFLDLLLSGDNAVVIALACRSLPDRQKRQAMLLGTGIAILLRVLLTLVASAVLQVPLLKLLGGVALTVIAIQLTLDDPYAVIGDNEKLPGGGAGRADLLSVIGTVVVADLVMSTDKVVALAAVAKGSVAVLALGLLLSVPLLMFGSWYVTALLKRYPVLPRLGGAMLGWFAGDIAVSDPLYAGWIEQQSPALSVVVPVLVAAYVLLQSRIIDQSRASATTLRLAHEPRPIKSGQALIADTALVQSSSAAAKPLTASRAAVVPAHEPVRLTLHAERADERFKHPRDGAPVTVSEVPPIRARRNPRAKPLCWLAIGGGSVLAIGAVYGLLSSRWMPVPADLTRYDCPGKDVGLYYRPGGPRMRFTNGVDSVEGVVQNDNQIDWGDYHRASSTLGFVPPTRVLFGNSRSVRIDGGMFEDAICDAH